MATLQSWIGRLSEQPLPVWRESRRQLLALARRGRYNGPALIRALAHDPLLCAQILRRANAGRAGGDIATLEQAAVMLGARALFDLAERLPVLEERLEAPDMAALRQLERRSFHVAYLARDLTYRYSDRRYDDAFFAGLLHNLGELALRVHSPPVVAGIYRLADIHRIGFEKAAKDVLGCGIPDLSAALAHHWRLPALVRAVLDSGELQSRRSELVRLSSAILRDGPSRLRAAGEGTTLARVAEILMEPWESTRTTVFHAATGAAAWLCERLPTEDAGVVELFPESPVGGRDNGGGGGREPQR